MSNNDYNRRYQDVIVAAITSNVTDRVTNDETVEGELKVDSAIRADKIYTLSQSIALRKFGKVQPEVLLNVKKQIDGWLSE